MRGTALALALLTGAAACAPEPSEEAAPPAAAAAAADVADTAAGGNIEGVEWRLLSLRGRPADTASADRPATLQLDAAAGRASGNLTCNRFGGPYTLAGDSLGFGMLVSTKMACVRDELNRQEVEYQAALQATRSWRMAGDTLVLMGDGAEQARFRRD